GQCQRDRARLRPARWKTRVASAGHGWPHRGNDTRRRQMAVAARGEPRQGNTADAGTDRRPAHRLRRARHDGVPAQSDGGAVMTTAQVEARAGTEPRTIDITVTGEIDLSNVDHVREEIYRVIANDLVLVRLDLNHVTYLDSSGLRILRSAERRVGAAG